MASSPTNAPTTTTPDGTNPQPPRRDWMLTPEAFEKLLEFLDKDREKAARAYITLYGKLIAMFSRRGLADAEALADETMDRVAKQLERDTEPYIGDPALRFYKTAQYIIKEKLRPKPAPPPQPDPDPPEFKELASVCLDKCMEPLPAEDR